MNTFQLIKKSSLVILYIAISMFFVGLFLFILKYINIIPSNINEITSLDILMSTFIQALIFVITAVFFIRLAKINYYKLGDSSSFLQTIGEVFIGILGLLIVQAIASSILSLFGIEAKQFESLNKDLLLKQPMYFFIAITLIAPFYEEFVFRSVIMGYLIKYRTRPSLQIKTAIYPIVFSSFIFGAMHFDLDAFFPLFMTGIYLGIVTFYKRGIKLSIILHLINNIIGGLAFVYHKELLEMSKQIQ